jgi:hypothetical protein
MDARRSAPVPDSERPPVDADEPPPILGRWSALYAIVLGELALVIAVCYGLSRWGR